ncbi:MAG: flagellar basal body P-ring formation chaperone FlgA [Proteobacteria bacterium]|nr:flagellar basal body P-ring formation chaperone FlgA [Pseudomonadota bacterium]MBU1649791.1 flagellar basal body P-ring formation chaperone FlgA [Pseudomonadota bacterium]
MKTEYAGQSGDKDRKTGRGTGSTLLLTTLLFLGMTFPCHAFDITFRTTGTVSGASVTLAEIADISTHSELAEAMARQTVAASPDAGQEILLDSNSIAQKLTRAVTTPAEINWGGAGTVTVTRQGITITAQSIQKIIEAYLAEQGKVLPNAKYTFTPKDPPLPFMIPTGDVKWEVIPSNPGIIGSNRFSLIGRLDSQVVKNFSVRGTLEVLAPVAVAVSNLRRGDLVAETQIQMEPRDISTLRAPCLQLQQVIGKTLLQSIKAGSVIDLSSIEFPPVVKKGAFVKILGQNNGLQLTASGIAKTDGKQGQTIKVKNSSSDKVIFCRVTAPGLVEVQL